MKVNVASGSLHGPIGVNVNSNAAPFLEEQTGTLTFLHKFGAGKAENCTSVYAACHVHIRKLHAMYAFAYRILRIWNHSYKAAQHIVCLPSDMNNTWLLSQNIGLVVRQL